MSSPKSIDLPALIISTQALADACARLARFAFVTVDTEFLRETTYYSKLCLIQMASPEEVVLVDTLAPGLDLSPFFDLMANQAVLKVFHAARQDIEIIVNKCGKVPAPLFDSQVAAMVCGYGDQVSYESLAGSLAGAKIDKSSRFTDWSRRPLSEAQLVYAAADVTHLRVVYEKLSARLAKTGRANWVNEEMAVLTDPATYDAAPERAHERIKARLRKPQDFAALIELAAWREREAQARDVPRARVLKDEALVEIALAAPKSPEDLGRLRALPSGFERSRLGGDVLAAVARGIARPAESLPPMPDGRGHGSSNGALVQLLKVLLQASAERHHVAAKLIATVDDLERLAGGETTDLLPLRGWRAEVFGTAALELKSGALALALEKGRVVAVKRPSAE